MKSSVMIKGNKYGFLVVLNPSIPFEQLMEDIGEKFQESARFFNSKEPVALSFEGRDLTEEEQDQLIEVILEKSDLNIGCILNGAKQLESKFESLLSSLKLNEEETVEGKENDIKVADRNIEKDGQFYRGTLRSGQRIDVNGSIVVLGDVNPGAQIVAGGNVVVLGSLKGSVYAGYPENKEAFVASLMMNPMQIQIGSCIARASDEKVKWRRLGRKKKPVEMEAKMAFVENDNIFIETITRSLINEISLGKA